MPKIPTFTAQTRMTADVADIKTQYQAPLTGGPVSQLIPVMQKLNDYYVAQQDLTEKIEAKKETLTKAQKDAKAKALKAEQAANEKRINAAAEALKAAEAPEVVEEEVAEVAAEETAAEEVVAEVAAEEVVAEEAAATEETPAFQGSVVGNEKRKAFDLERKRIFELDNGDYISGTVPSLLDSGLNVALF